MRSPRRTSASRDRLASELILAAAEGPDTWPAGRIALLAFGLALGEIVCWWLARIRQAKAAAARHAPQSHELLFQE